MPSQTEEQALVCVLDVTGMDCASCVAHVTRAAQSLPGVSQAQVNLARGRAVVSYDPETVQPEQIARAITDAGYPAAAQAPDHAAHAARAEEQRVAHQHAHAQAWLRRAVAGVALWLPVELVHWILALTSPHAHHATGPSWMDWIALATSTMAILYVGGAFFRSAWGALRHGTSNMDTLISLGTGVAYGYSLIALGGYLMGWWVRLPSLYFMEATGLLALISLGHYLEARARDQAGSAIRELLNLAPATAMRVVEDGRGQKDEGGRQKDEPKDDTPPLGESRHPASSPTQDSGLRTQHSVVSTQDSIVSTSTAYEEVPVHELHPGDRILIRPGDRIPVDGQVIAGKSEVDEAMITGEPIPVLRQLDDAVIGGTLNQTGRLIIRATKVGAETALAQIVALVEQAQNSRPPVQRLADRISAIFVPAVLAIALVTAVGWYLYGTLQGWAPAEVWAQVAKSACSVLIIACPCALGLAVPAALMVGTGRGARRGILIRDIDALQHAEQITTVVLDKTGTITQGRPVVSRVIPADGVEETELLRLAGSAEQFSEHPLARSIVQMAQARGVRLSDPESFEYEPGMGVVAGVDGQTLLVGNAALLERHGGDGGNGAASAEASEGHRSVVHVARRTASGSVQRLGTLLIDDQIKPDSKVAIEELHRLGLKTVLLTGDNEQAARAIARQVHIDDVRAGVRPDQKAMAVQQIRQQHGGRIAMVGDGINDAPALAQADLGIAIGSGSDIAKETGGIVLVSGSLHGIATSLRLSRATMRKIRQNLFFAFFYNVLAIPLASLGLLTPLIAAGAMALSDVTVIGNALLLRRSRIDPGN